jgi:hypothetical protein
MKDIYTLYEGLLRGQQSTIEDGDKFVFELIEEFLKENYCNYAGSWIISEKPNKDGLYEVVSSYKIELLDNFNVYYHLYYDIQINDHLTLNVYKTFDRLNLVNDEVYTFKTANTNEFNDLLLNEEELDAVTSFVKGKEVTTRLVNEFKDRNDEFEYKKDSLGHYGIGNYEGSYSFVVYKDNDSYYSKLKYTSVAKELIK